MCRTRRSSAFRLAAGRRNARAGAALSSSRETTCLNDAQPTYRSDIPLRQQPRDLSQERDRWFESGSLQQTVCVSPGTWPLRVETAWLHRRVGGAVGRDARDLASIARKRRDISLRPYSSTAAPLMS